jgi:hypothetical protein
VFEFTSHRSEKMIRKEKMTHRSRTRKTYVTYYLVILV